MSTIYEKENVKNAVQNVLTNAWNKMKTNEQTLVATRMKTTSPPTVDEIMKWGPFNDYKEETVMKKALQSKVKSWFRREAKKLNELVEQTDFGAQIDSKKNLSKTRIQKLRVRLVENGIYTNDNWSNGITEAALLMVRFGLASFSTFASCFIYFNEKSNYVAKLVNGEDGTKIVKYVSI